MPDILTNKSFKTYKRLSRYSTTPYYYNKVDNKYIYGTAPNLKTNTPYRSHKVKNGETLDILALNYYNNPTYFWIIADYNKIQDPFLPLTEGSVVKIPTISSIEFEK